jgi:hypothetical protein
MLRGGGFKSKWGLIGFKVYFWRYSKKPNWVKTMPNHKPSG